MNIRDPQASTMRNLYIRKPFLVAAITCTFSLLSACSGTSTRSITKCEPLDTASTPIPEILPPGSIVQVESKGIVTLIVVDRYEGEGLLVGKGRLGGEDVEIAINEIEKLCAPSPTQEKYERPEDGGSSLINDLAYAPLLLLVPITLPLTPYFAAADKRREEERRDVRSILDPEQKLYHGQTTEQVQSALGAPLHKYACKGLDSPWYSQIWEYSDEQIRGGRKYFHFGPRDKKLYFISDWSPSGCLLFNGQPPEPTPQEIVEHEAKQTPAN